MRINSQTSDPDGFKFDVARIRLLQSLLARANKTQVNKFIDEIRAHVLTYHQFQDEIHENDGKKALEQFYHQLNNKAHQLSRFTLELSRLVSVAPAKLFEEAQRANRSIDSIHGNLVNLCLTIDDIMREKSNLVVDATITVKKIHDAYQRIFEVQPNGRSYIEEGIIPDDEPMENLLVPVVEILLLKDHLRCYSLVQKIIQNKGNAIL